MVGLLALAASQRAALLRQDRAAGADLLRAYALVRRRLQADLDALTVRIAQARAAGETVNRAWLAREVRYHSLLAQVEAQVGQFARVAEGRILTEQRLAALAGGEQAGALIRAALPDGGAGVAFNRLPTQAFGELVGVLGDGSPLSALLGQLGPQAGQAVRDALIEGVGTGLGPRQIAREVVKATNLSAVRALRIARNETLRAFRSASQETYKANADVLSGWVWWAALSKRTCPICYAMHGTFHKLDEPFASHVACRCTQLPQTKGSRLAVTRGAEAFGKLPEEDQRAILGPGKFAAYRRGDLALDDLVAKTRDRDWGPGRRERTLREVLAAPKPAPTRAFIPAKSAAEAEAFARSLGVGQVDYRGKVAVGNAANAGLAQLRDAGYGVPGSIQVRPGNYSALYNNGVVYLNPRSPWFGKDAAEVAQRERARGLVSTTNPQHPIIHESGHALHDAQNPERYPRLKSTALDSRQQALARAEVSNYAATNAVEFVAEVFAGLVDGKNYSADVMQLYRQFHGPLREVQAMKQAAD